MKRILQTLFLSAAISMSATAQNEPADMIDALKSTYSQFDTTQSLASMTPLSTRFELIAEAYPDQWLAQYYAAFTKVMMSYMEPDMAKKDLLVDQAQEYMDVISTLKIENDERYILEAFIANGRLAVDGEKRWMKYGPIFDKNLEKAKKLNPDNVHYYYLKGTSLYYTPKMFGGGAKNALPYFEKAKELYAKMDMTNVKVPYWGHYATDYFLNEIKNAKEE